MPQAPDSGGGDGRVGGAGRQPPPAAPPPSNGGGGGGGGSMVPPPGTGPPGAAGGHHPGGGPPGGYHPYQFPPPGMFGFPPQAPAPPPNPMMGGPPPPHESYGHHGGMGGVMGGGMLPMGMGMAPGPHTIMMEGQPPTTHVCTVHPPGIPRAFDVPFPERRLPVCDRCKKNFKSRDLCRKRDGHKALPWQSTYVVVTIDETALKLGEDDVLIYENIPVTAELQETPLMCLGPADGSMKLEPICKVCREKNYTRDYCRNTCKHTTPPWSTTYVKLKAERTTGGEGHGGEHVATRRRDGKKRKKGQEEQADGRPMPMDPGEGGEGIEDRNDDLTKIHESRTFLAAISSRQITVRWCARIQYPEPSERNNNADASRANPGAMPPYGAGGGAGAASAASLQHQNVQLWDAFRAGAIWAQSQGGGQMPPMPYGYPMGPMAGFGFPPPGPPAPGPPAPGPPPAPGGSHPPPGGYARAPAIPPLQAPTPPIDKPEPVREEEGGSSSPIQAEEEIPKMDTGTI